MFETQLLKALRILKENKKHLVFSNNKEAISDIKKEIRNLLLNGHLA